MANLASDFVSLVYPLVDRETVKTKVYPPAGAVAKLAPGFDCLSSPLLVRERERGRQRRRASS